MIRAVGLDIVEIARIKKDVVQYGDRFLNRILGQEELALYDQRQDKDLFLAGRFAAKEAIIKTLATTFTHKPPLTELQIINDPGGQPLFKGSEEIQKKLANTRFHLSISHEKNYAAAVAILVEE
jgi:holo-[acyl-carrier protein] synthase